VSSAKIGNHKKSETAKNFSYRPPAHLAVRFEDVAAVSLRTKASILHQGLAVVLPDLEKKYKDQLKAFRTKNK
jgi:hypothetical protein